MNQAPVVLTDHREPILALISPAQRDFLVWCRDKMPYGEVKVTTRAGVPRRVDQAVGSAVFDD